MLYTVHDGTAMSDGLAFLMHFGSKPTSTVGALLESPLSTSAFPDVSRKAGLVPSGSANVAEVLLLEASETVPPLNTHAAVGSAFVPAATPTLLIIVSPCVIDPSVK